MSERLDIEDYLAAMALRSAEAEAGRAEEPEEAKEQDDEAEQAKQAADEEPERPAEAEEPAPAFDRTIVNLVPVDSRVLEVSCGGGILAEDLRRKGCEVWGVDARAGACALGGRHLDLVVDNAGRRFAALPNRDNSFDVLVMEGVLERMIDPAGVLKDGLAYVRPGGMAVLSVPNGVVWQNRIAFLLGRMPRSACQLQLFNKRCAIQLARRVGLAVSEVRPSNQRGARAGWLARLLPTLFASSFVLVGQKAGAADGADAAAESGADDS